jgi:hypothetical protein
MIEISGENFQEFLLLKSTIVSQGISIYATLICLEVLVHYNYEPTIEPALPILSFFCLF